MVRSKYEYHLGYTAAKPDSVVDAVMVPSS